MKIYNLHFKWTVSRGRDTYGYNICTLLVNGDKKGRCNGGGYDMQGTSFAQWLQSDFQDELQKLFAAEIEAVKAIPQTISKDFEGKEYKYSHERFPVKSFYGATAIKNNATGTCYISLDGACGFSSMEDIAKAIGIKLQWNKESDRYKNSTFYTAIIEPSKN